MKGSEQAAYIDSEVSQGFNSGSETTLSTPIQYSINELGEIKLVIIGNKKDSKYLIWKTLIERYHYLGRGKLYGLQIRYLIHSERLGWIGAISYSSAAWRLQARDEWIGWDEQNRINNLNRVICNSRFLIVPYLKANNLASYILSKSIKRIKKDWADRYGVEPVLVETFVEKGRYIGTCYQAANFKHIGQTKGRGRQDRTNKRALPVKDIYLYTIRADIKNELCNRQDRQDIADKGPKDWAEEEFRGAGLKDKRLKKRLIQIARDFYAKPQANIPQASESRAKSKAAYRFMDNDKSTMDNILKGHYQTTAGRIKGEAVVLAVQDTTTLNYSLHPATERLGPIGSKEEGVIGLIVHDTMAFNLEGTPLGLIDVQCWARDIEKYGKKHQRHKLPIAEKESNKWLISYKAAAEVQKEASKTQIVSVGDREADIYELFELGAGKAEVPKLLVRASHNRRLGEEQGQLMQKISEQEVIGRQVVRVPKKGNQPSREAELAIRYREVKLKAPAGKKAKGDIRVWAVQAEEEIAPEGVRALKWILLTTMPVNTFQDAVEKVQWYSKRWGIEVYHKTLKSGCQIEQRQLGNADRIEACLAIDMVVAWRIYHLTKLGREVPEVPCTVYFEEAEWKALVAYKTRNPKPPSEPPTLREAVRMVGSLGGFLGRKSDGEPGTKTLWLGLERLDDITSMWKVFVVEPIPKSLSP